MRTQWGTTIWAIKIFETYRFRYFYGKSPSIQWLKVLRRNDVIFSLRRRKFKSDDVSWIKVSLASCSPIVPRERTKLHLCRSELIRFNPNQFTSTSQICQLLKNMNVQGQTPFRVFNICNISVQMWLQNLTLQNYTYTRSRLIPQN